MKMFLDKFEIDSYELGARYIPAFIFEILFLFSFYEYLNIDLNILKQLNEIFPLSVYFPALILIFSFPIKAILRLIGEILENIIWQLINPTIFYIKHRVKNLEKIIIFIKECGETKQSLKNIIEKDECHQALVEYLKTKTRDDKKLRTKLIEHGFFRNSFAGFLLLAILDGIFIKRYWFFYLIFTLIFFILMLMHSYWSYPKQLMNSFREKYIKENKDS
jgi:hypothetical protein